MHIHPFDCFPLSQSKAKFKEARGPNSVIQLVKLSQQALKRLATSAGILCLFLLFSNRSPKLLLIAVKSTTWTCTSRPSVRNASPERFVLADQDYTSKARVIAAADLLRKSCTSVTKGAAPQSRVPVSNAACCKYYEECNMAANCCCCAPTASAAPSASIAIRSVLLPAIVRPKPCSC